MLRRLTIGLIAACAGVVPAVAEAPPPLQPYQMVRSLQLLQDRLASGDHAALPLQKKLLELIDKRLRESEDAVFEEKRNVRAALVYGMSGGNPLTLSAVFRKPTISEDDRRLGQGVLNYLQGNPAAAQNALANVDPRAMPSEIGAFLALVKGSVTSVSDPTSALKQFDTARLLGPGTLVEEAALRRSLALAASLGQRDRFYLAANQYVRRFLRSPYASQFADSLVSGILTLHDKLNLDALDEITAMMDPDQRRVIFLRLARRAAIDGLTDLSVFAASRAELEPDAGKEDPRSQLYSSLSTLTSENIDEVTARLKSIDRQQLSESDIRLLDAAEAIVSSVTAKPRVAPEPETKDAGTLPASAPVASAPAAAEPSSPNAGEPAPVADAASAPQAPSATQAAPTQAEAAAAPADPTDSAIQKTKATLGDIDKMLEEAK